MRDPPPRTTYSAATATLYDSEGLEHWIERISHTKDKRQANTDRETEPWASSTGDASGRLRVGEIRSKKSARKRSLHFVRRFISPLPLLVFVTRSNTRRARQHLAPRGGSREESRAVRPNATLLRRRYETGGRCADSCCYHSAVRSSERVVRGSGSWLA